MSYIHVPLAAWLLAALTPLAAAAEVLTLTDAHQSALRADPTIRAAARALQAGREKSVQGQALLRPQIALSASVTGVRDHSDVTLPPAIAALAQPDTSGHVGEAAIRWSQPLYSAAANVGKRQLMQQSASAEIRSTAASQDLIRRVAETYLAVVLARENLQVTQAESDTLRHQSERAQARFSVGSSRVTDLLEAQARLDGAIAKVLVAQSGLELRLAQFRALTGVEGEALRTLPPVLRLAQPFPDELTAWQDRALEHNAQVQVKRIEGAIAADEIGKYRLESRPTLDLVGSYTFKGKEGDLSLLVAPDRERTATLGLQFNVPLYAGGALDSREREALARARQLEEELAATRQDVQLQVQDAFLALKTGIARAKALEQAVQSYRSARDATTLARDVGSRTQLDVLDAQQRYFAAQLDWSQARVDVLLGQVRLAWVAGTLEEAHLRDLDQVLRP